MLSLHNNIRYFLYQGGAGMRKSFDRLCGLVTNEMHQGVTGGDVFIFLNKRKTHIKLLVWEADGFAIYYKRLEQGTYELPDGSSREKRFSITYTQLMLILQGVSLKKVHYRIRLTSILLPVALFRSLLISSGCQRNSKKEFKATCIFTNAFPQEIYLSEWYTDSLPNVDSAYISDDRREIIFKGKLDEERLFTIYSKSIHGPHLDIILSDTPVIVYINRHKTNWLSSRTEGSYSFDLLQSNIKNSLKYGKARMELRNR